MIIPDRSATETSPETLNDIQPQLEFNMELSVNIKIPFLGMNISKINNMLETSVYRKPTNTGLLVIIIVMLTKDTNTVLLTLRSTVPIVYRLVLKLLNLNVTNFAPCFLNCVIPNNLINYIFSSFKNNLNTNNANNAISNNAQSVRIMLPFKDQASAGFIRQ